MNRSALAVALLLPAIACGEADSRTPGQAGEVSAETSAEARTTAPLPTVLVYKTESCGCCNAWVDHLRAAGFTVDTRNVVDLMSVKRDAGVPASHASCHTALVDGYVVEGHVPADQIERLLAERPEVAGLAVPGMPVGSPGMEGPGAKPYQVLAFGRQGESSVYATVDPR
ncbi:MAG TPA: DUF411 domain-containing protein [Longimicrobiales bacterium]|nr:DUF411 domain-containing protein [Longimicrobiales bacterium]